MWSDTSTRKSAEECFASEEAGGSEPLSQRRVSLAGKTCSNSFYPDGLLLIALLTRK